MSKRKQKRSKKLRYACGNCEVIGATVDEDWLCMGCGGSTVIVDSQRRVVFASVLEFDLDSTAPRPHTTALLAQRERRAARADK